MKSSRNKVTLNPFLKRNGDLVNPHINYQAVLDGARTNARTKEFIERATGLKPTKTVSSLEKIIPSFEKSAVTVPDRSILDSLKESVSEDVLKSDDSFGLPVTTSSYKVSSGFGPRNTGIKGASTYHKAIDIACDGGEDVVSVKPGKVIYSGWVKGYGYTAEVDHGNGVVTKYHHMAEAPSVKVGENVKKGQVVGKVGSTGISSGNHLDFQIFINGEAKDPAKYLPLK